MMVYGIGFSTLLFDICRPRFLISTGFSQNFNLFFHGFSALPALWGPPAFGFPRPSIADSAAVASSSALILQQ